MPPDRALNVAVLLLLGAAVVAWQAATLWYGRRWASIGDFLRFLQRPWPLRGLLLLGWFWLGWHFFVRGSW